MTSVLLNIFLVSFIAGANEVLQEANQDLSQPLVIPETPEEKKLLRRRIERLEKRIEKLRKLL